MYKVLVVENNPVYLKLLHHFLKEAGCEVRSAVDGLKALAVLDSFTPDIIFTDIVMPKISGDQFCRIVRQTPDFQDIFLVVFSSTIMENSAQIFDLDVDVCIVKSSQNGVRKHIQKVLSLYKEGVRRYDVVLGSEGLRARNITRELLLAKRHFNAIFENIGDAAIELDQNGQIIQANKAAIALFQSDLISLIASQLTDHLAGPQFEEIHQWIFQQHGKEPAQFKSDYNLPLTIKGRMVVLSLVTIPEDTHLTIIAIFQDITDRKETETQLARTLAEFNAIIESVDYGVLFMDANLKARIVNKAFRQMWNVPKSLVDSHPTLRELINFNRHDGLYDIPEEDFDAFIDSREEMVRQGDIKPVEILRKDGRSLQYQCVSLPDGGRMLTYFDITELKNVEAALAKSLKKVKKLANHDPLTNLPNLRLARERLTTTLSLAKRKKWKVAIMFLDLDGFKKVNDSFGHDTGDKLLKMVAVRLTESLRETDTVARIGGDEFLIIQTEVRENKDVAAVAQKIVTNMAKPFALLGNTVEIGVSIGISLYPDHGKDGGHLLKNADNAMYMTKEGGKNSFTFFTNGH